MAKRKRTQIEQERFGDDHGGRRRLQRHFEEIDALHPTEPVSAIAGYTQRRPRRPLPL